MQYTITASSDFGSCRADDTQVQFTAGGNYEQSFFQVEFSFPDWTADCYLMMPACAYHGNRFHRVKRSYPPMYLPEEAYPGCPPLITDVPALNPDGSGKLQVTSGDMAVPCLGLFSPKQKKGFLIFAQQEVKGKNLGFTVETGKLILSYPAHRDDLYRFCRKHDTSGDQGIPVQKGEQLSSEYRIFTFPCETISDLFRFFFEKRKCLMHSPRPKNGYTKQLWELEEQKFNQYNWSGEYYAEVSKVWQCGWVGGGMSSLPLLQHGTKESKQRAVQTLDYLTAHQAPSGFFYGTVKNGQIENDGFGAAGMEQLHLIRKSADSLYFLLKHFDVTAPKQSWIKSAQTCADAFVKLFQTYGTFGQFINVITGEMMVDCSTSGAIGAGALAKAWKYFGKEEYLKTAKQACQFYMENHVHRGVTSGGPGEILSAPDSESAFAMLESCITLYETTKEPQWLEYAKDCAHLCSSWVVPYAYHFPENSEFHRLKINTVGSVFANVQNKHSAPGICTLSGDSLYKLYRYTGEKAYLELIKDIAYCIPQCVSTKERPIYTCDVPPKQLPEGFIHERINMSDWETAKCVGGVFYGSCWCETSLLLTYTELMCYKEMREDETNRF